MHTSLSFLVVSGSCQFPFSDSAKDATVLAQVNTTGSPSLPSASGYAGRSKFNSQSEPFILLSLARASFRSAKVGIKCSCSPALRPVCKSGAMSHATKNPSGRPCPGRRVPALVVLTFLQFLCRLQCA
eukprot:6457544-Amphidinium_carterae.1